MSTASYPTSPPPPPPSSPPPSAAPQRLGAAGRDSAVVALGLAFLAAAIVISTINSRRDGELDWSNYGVGIAATLGLLAVALVGHLLVKDPAASATLVSWPVAFGAVGAGLMVGVALDDAGATAYVSGLVVIAIAAAGYLVVRSAPPALAAVLGLVAVYGQALDDTIDLGGADEGFIAAAVAVLVFVLIATAAAWVLPAARVVVGVAVGAFAVVSYLALLAVIALASIFVGLESSFSAEPGAALDVPDYDDDVYVILGLGLLLVLLWCVAGALTDHPGFKVLMIAMTATVLPAGLLVLAVAHPSWWGVLVGVVGGLLMVAITLRSLRSDDPGVSAASTGPTGAPPFTTN